MVGGSALPCCAMTFTWEITRTRLLTARRCINVCATLKLSKHEEYSSLLHSQTVIHLYWLLQRNIFSRYIYIFPFHQDGCVGCFLWGVVFSTCSESVGMKLARLGRVQFSVSDGEAWSVFFRILSEYIMFLPHQSESQHVFPPHGEQDCYSGTGHLK